MYLHWNISESDPHSCYEATKAVAKKAQRLTLAY